MGLGIDFLDKEGNPSPNFNIVPRGIGLSQNPEGLDLIQSSSKGLKALRQLCAYFKIDSVLDIQETLLFLSIGKNVSMRSDCI